MAAYTFISSRDPVDGDRSVHDLAASLAAGGNDVTLFMVENGAFLARDGVCADVRKKLQGAGVKLLADDFSLAERGVEPADGIESAPLSVLVDHLAEGRKVAWH